MKRRLSLKQKLQHNFELGADGEARAKDFLISQGFQVLDTNVAFGVCEIDIVAMDLSCGEAGELVFAEVKTRSASFYGNPSGAVGFKKVRALQKAAAQYRREHELYQMDYRFDVLAVLPDSVEHYKNVTW